MAISFIFTLGLAPLFIAGWILTGYSGHIYAFQKRYWLVGFIMSAAFWFCAGYFVYDLSDTQNSDDSTVNDYVVFGAGIVALILLFIYSIFLRPPRNNNTGKFRYFVEFIGLVYSVIFFAPYTLFGVYYISGKALRYYVRCIFSWGLLCTVHVLEVDNNKVFINVEVKNDTHPESVYFIETINIHKFHFV